MKEKLAKLSKIGLKAIGKDYEAASVLTKIVGVAIGIFVVAVIIPPALETLAGASLSGVDSSVVTILTVLLPILAIVGIALYFLPRFRE